MIPGQDDCAVGIVGGVGPEAGGILFQYTTMYTSASCDQEHLSVILMSFPKYMADRTDFIKGKTAANPAYAISVVIRKLYAAGAKIMGIACNTSHVPAIYDVLLWELRDIKDDITLLHMPREVCGFIKSAHAGKKRIGIMASDGTYYSDMYQELLTAFGFHVIRHDDWFQENVIHQLIYHPEMGLKANPNGIHQGAWRLWEEARTYFSRERADIIVLACTEFSILRQKASVDIILIDSVECLAKAFIREAQVNNVGIMQNELKNV